MKASQYKVVCCQCGKECLVPVPPPRDKKLTCLACLAAAERLRSQVAEV